MEAAVWAEMVLCGGGQPVCGEGIIHFYVVKHQKFRQKFSANVPNAVEFLSELLMFDRVLMNDAFPQTGCPPLHQILFRRNCGGFMGF